MARRQYEAPQGKNKYELTVDQHVFPRRSIERFAGPDGRVRVFDLVRRKERPATPGDRLFCAWRVWDQRAEQGYMRDIEDRFQRLAERVIADPGQDLPQEDDAAASRFFALWHCRAAYKHLPDGEFQLNGVEGPSRTKDEEERLESRWTGYIRESGGVPSRQLYGLRIQRDIDAIEDQLNGRRWGIVALAPSVELIVPDAPPEAVIPVTPALCLACGTKSGTLSPGGARDLNSRIARNCRAYWFYRAAPDLDADLR